MMYKELYFSKYNYAYFVLYDDCVKIYFFPNNVKLLFRKCIDVWRVPRPQNWKNPNWYNVYDILGRNVNERDITPDMRKDIVQAIKFINFA